MNASRNYRRTVESEVALIHRPVCNMCPDFSVNAVKPRSPLDGAVAHLKSSFIPQILTGYCGPS